MRSDVRADAVDLGAERYEKAAEILHVRLAGGVLERRLPSASTAAMTAFSVPVTLASSRNNVVPLKTLGAHLVPLSGLDLGAERGERVDMGVDPAPADDVSARRRHRGGAEAGEQRPREEDGCADLVAELLVELRRRHARRVDAHLVRADPVGLRAGTADEGEHRVHVEDPRDVLELDGLAREQRRGENRQRGVLVPGRLHAPGERVPSLDHERLSQGV